MAGDNGSSASVAPPFYDVCFLSSIINEDVQIRIAFQGVRGSVQPRCSSLDDERQDRIPATVLPTAAMMPS